MQYICKYQSPFGGITISADGNSLTGLWFDGQKYFAATLPAAHEEKQLPVFDQTRKWLDSYFSGENPGIYTPVTPRRVVLSAGRMGNIAANTVWGNNYLQGYCERNRTAAGKANHVGAGHRRCRRAQSDQHYHPLP